MTRFDLLTGVHPDLVRVVLEASQHASFDVVEGVRTLAQEIIYISQGKSSLRNPYLCRHVPKGNPAYSRAVDLVPIVGGVKFPSDWSKYPPMVKAMKDAAHKLNIPLEWGGDWHTFKDGPHFQLPAYAYP